MSSTLCSAVEPGFGKITQEHMILAKEEKQVVYTTVYDHLFDVQYQWDFEWAD